MFISWSFAPPNKQTAATALWKMLPFELKFFFMTKIPHEKLCKVSLSIQPTSLSLYNLSMTWTLGRSIPTSKDHKWISFPAAVLWRSDSHTGVFGFNILNVLTKPDAFSDAAPVHTLGREHFILRDGYVIGWWDCALRLLCCHLILHFRHYMFSSIHNVQLTCSKREDHLSLEPAFIKASQFTPFPWIQSWKESSVHVPITGIFYLSRQHEIKVSHTG